jgi:hypothetical protein
MRHVKIHGSEQPVLVDDEDFPFVCRFEWYLRNGHAFTLVNGRPIEMGYPILHPEIVDEPSAN